MQDLTIAQSALIESPNDKSRRHQSALAEMAEEIREEIRGITDLAEDALARAIRVGGLLCVAKAKCKHGDFGAWCLRALDLRPSYCALLMRLFNVSNEIPAARAWAGS